MTGIFNNNPPSPKHVFIWDVKKVLRCWAVWTVTRNYPIIRFFILKLTVLLSLTSTGRGHEIAYPVVRHIIETENVIIFYFSKITKSWKFLKLVFSFSKRSKASYCSLSEGVFEKVSGMGSLRQKTIVT